MDGSDDPLGLVALLAACLLFRRDWSERSSALPTEPLDLRLPAALTFLYAFLSPWLPNLFDAALAVSALGVLGARISRTRLRLPRLVLLLLSLPWVASLQFVFGYPLRIAAAVLAQRLLQLGIQPVHREGLVLVQGPIRVLVDAPCSGVKMLWAALLLAALLAENRRLKAVSFLWLALAGVVLSVVGNGFRAANLFLAEVHFETLPYGLHDGVGLILFGMVAALLCALAYLLEDSDPPRGATPPVRSRGILVFGLACLAAVFSPWVQAPSSRHPASDFPGFPQSLAGVPLIPRPLSPVETRAAQTVPGRVGRFAWGSGELVLTWLAKPSRSLHPARDCYRGIGATCRALPETLNAAGQAQGRLMVTRKGRQYQIVYEQVIDADGHSYSDVGAWFWAAILGQSRGPWWAIRYAESKSQETAESSGNIRAKTLVYPWR